jgi:hypothetical protein
VAHVAVPERNSVTGTFYRDHVPIAVIHHYKEPKVRSTKDQLTQ